jgi:hypothetical protein
MSATIAGGNPLYADNYFDPIPEIPYAGAVVARWFAWTVVAATAPGTGDQVLLCRIPGSHGVLLLGIVIDIPQIDSGSGVVIKIGNRTTVDAYFTTTLTSTAGQAASRLSSFMIASPSGAVTGGSVIGSLPDAYAPSTSGSVLLGNDDLVLTTSTGITTPVAGAVVRGYILYTQWGIKPVTIS